jgi:DNA-binding transcriptional MerR regulator
MSADAAWTGLLLQLIKSQGFLMYVTELAKQTGVAPDTIRYYTKIGLLNPDRHPDNRYHVYTSRDRSRLRFVRAAKALGYTLTDIRKLFADAGKGNSACPRARALIEKHIRDIEERLADLTALHERMVAALGEWQALPDASPTADSVCALIEIFDSDS